MESPFDSVDFVSWLDGSYESATGVVPLLLATLQPRSVVDVGCGLGAWLAVFREHGIVDVLGFDGPWVDRQQLRIPREAFVAADLREAIAAPRRFDLALCLEVAHLIEPEHAPTLVRSLTSLSEVVAFSAGIPGQGGFHHLNEQWPRYWADLFAARGYVATDPFRVALWEAENVKWWFAQNLVCYASRVAIGRLEALTPCSSGAPLSLVHPDCAREPR